MDPTTREQAARDRAKAVRDFYGHAMIFGAVMFMLAIIDVFTGEELWFYWPMLFWGVGLAAHAFGALVTPRILSPDWENRQVAKYLGSREPRA